MLGLSRDDWNDYEKRCLKARSEWLRGLTNEAAFALYQELYALGSSQEIPQALKELRWKEKRALREKMVAVFRDIDRRHGAGSTGENSR